MFVRCCDAGADDHVEEQALAPHALRTPCAIIDVRRSSCGVYSDMIWSVWVEYRNGGGLVFQSGVGALQFLNVTAGVSAARDQRVQRENDRAPRRAESIDRTSSLNSTAVAKRPHITHPTSTDLPRALDPLTKQNKGRSNKERKRQGKRTHRTHLSTVCHVPYHAAP